MDLEYSVLSPKTWKAFENLFGGHGACGGCWCMTPRLSSAAYSKNKGEINKQLFKNLVKADEKLGIMAYHRGEPIAWCSISPKPRLLDMKNSRIMKLTATQDTWSIVCLFIKKEYRRKGVSSLIIKKAAEYAFQNGAKVVEAYPVQAKVEKVPDAFIWNGIWSAYEKAGFKKIKQVSETKVIAALQKYDFDSAAV
jgi:GNAT superfamily N-acetyltransferase